MNKNKYYHLLNQEKIDYLSSKTKKVVFQSETQIVYAKQVPMAAYLLISGKITLKDSRNKMIKLCPTNSLICFDELSNGLPFKYTAEIAADSEVLIFDKTTINSIKLCEDNPFKEESTAC